MKLIPESELHAWLNRQGWLSFSDHSFHFSAAPSPGLNRYEWKICEDSAALGCELAPLLLDGFTPANFPGGIFFIGRTFGTSDDDVQIILLNQILRAGGAAPRPWPSPHAIVLDSSEFETTLALIAISLMFGWDTSLALTGCRYLVTTDDEPFPAIITDRLGPYLTTLASDPSNDISVSTPT